MKIILIIITMTLSCCLSRKETKKNLLLRIENNSAARVVVWIDGEPIVSSSFSGNIPLQLVGAPKGEIKAILDMLPVRSNFTIWEINISAGNNNLIKFDGENNDFFDGASKSGKLQLAFSRKAFKVWDDHSQNKILQIVEKLFNEKSSNKESKILLKNIVSKSIYKTWSNNGKLEHTSRAHAKDIEIIKGQYFALLRVSQNGLRNGSYKDRSLIRFDGRCGEINLIEYILIAQKECGDIVVLGDVMWNDLF